jgi:3-deoxy-7-phosphoheptulonate synthase
VIVDPSHAAGDRSLVPSLAAAGIAAGADGVIVEVHNDPDAALCDGPQSLSLPGFTTRWGRLEGVADAGGRSLR